VTSPTPKQLLCALEQDPAGRDELIPVLRPVATMQGAYDAAKAGKEMVDGQSSGTDPCNCK